MTCIRVMLCDVGCGTLLQSQEEAYCHSSNGGMLVTVFLFPSCCVKFRSTNVFWTHVVPWKMKDLKLPTCQFRGMECWI